MTYRLDDAEERHRDNPRSFSIPRRAVREALPVGSLAKLLFLVGNPESEVGTELMWCLVKGRVGEEYLGTLDNEPQHARGLVLGDEVRFSARHVAGVSLQEEASMAPLVGCDLGVLSEGRWPTWIVRVPTDGKSDSGWRVFSAWDTAARARIRAVTASTMFRSWAVLDSVIDGDTQGAWRWNESALEFVAVDELPLPVATASSKGVGRLHPRPCGPDMKAVISLRVLEEPPRGAERMAPTKNEPEDSGWWFYVGDETQAYADDADNATIVPLGRLYHLYPYLERVTGETDEGAWEWDDALGDFRFVCGPDEDE